MPSREAIDTRERAERALRAGKAEDALALYRALITNVLEFEPGLYDAWLEGTFAAYRALGRKQEAAYVSMSLSRFAEAERLLDRRRRPVEWALCVSRQGRRHEAAGHLVEAGFPVLAAGELLAGDDVPGARKLFEKLLLSPRLRAHPYEEALVHVVLARLDRKSGDAESANVHATKALSGLEALADSHETRGLRERAFDCHTLILRMGKEQGSFENLCEGYTNAIRILVSDHQRYLPLQYADDFIAEAALREEWQAAAGAAHDAAEHSRRMGLAYERHYLSRATELWLQAAESARKQGMSAEAVENALSAALDAAATLGDLPLLGKIYGQLADVPIAPERKKRYAELGARYGRAAESPPKGARLPEHLFSPNPYPDIGWQDLIEWELDGEPLSTMAMVVLDHTDGVRYQRLALRALLVAAAPQPSSPGAGAQSDVAQALGNVRIYESLRPLERLFESEAVQVRAAVMAGVGKIFNKRSFVLVKQGLVDPDARVRDEARRTLRRLHFADGLDPLMRIFHETRAEDVREIALASIADIGSIDAGMFLLEVVREAPEGLRAIAIERLAGFTNAELLPHLRATLELTAEGNQQALRGVLRTLEAASV